MNFNVTLLLFLLLHVLFPAKNCKHCNQALHGPSAGKTNFIVVAIHDYFQSPVLINFQSKENQSLQFDNRDDHSMLSEKVHKIRKNFPCPID